jgi:hypothetical protein
MKNENEKHSLLFLNPPAFFFIFMGHFGCHCWDQSGGRGNGNGTAIAVDAGEWGGGRSCRASGAAMGERGERKTDLLCFWYLYQVRWAQTQWARLSVACMGGGWVTMVVVVVIIVRGGG